MNQPPFKPDAATPKVIDPRPRVTSPHTQTQFGIFTPFNLEGRDQRVREALHYFSPNILNKSSEELFSLLTSEKEFAEFFNGLPEVVNQKNTLKDFQNRNEKLALENLSFKDQLEQLRKDIEEKTKDIKELEDQFQNLKENESRLFEKVHPKTILFHLKDEQTLIDNESSELTAQFLRKDIPVEDYIKRFLESRTRFHEYDLRIAGTEKRALPIFDVLGASINFIDN